MGRDETRRLVVELYVELRIIDELWLEELVVAMVELVSVLDDMVLLGTVVVCEDEEDCEDIEDCVDWEKQLEGNGETTV